jgi:multiple sugar transport system permease protein
MKTLPVGIAVFAPGVGSKTQLEGFGIAMGAVPILSIPSLALFLFPEILRPGHFERSLKS